VYFVTEKVVQCLCTFFVRHGNLLKWYLKNFKENYKKNSISIDFRTSYFNEISNKKLSRCEFEYHLLNVATATDLSITTCPLWILFHANMLCGTNVLLLCRTSSDLCYSLLYNVLLSLLVFEIFSWDAPFYYIIYPLLVALICPRRLIFSCLLSFFTSFFYQFIKFSQSWVLNFHL
jgi:hypothetical protein